jgi:hypothetical protein
MGENAKDEAQWFLSALPLWELHSCKSYECLEPWLERQTNTKLGLQEVIRNILKRTCLKCLHIVHLDMICMHYDQKKGAWVKLEIWHPTINPLKLGGQMRFDWSVLYTIGKIFSKAIRYYICTHKINLIWEIYKRPKFWNNNSLNFGTPTWESRGKMTFGCSPCGEAHSIYYKEGIGASSQRLRAMWNLCLRLYLLSPSHHFHLTCTNCPLVLVM